jgi:hypothetical protein
MRFSFAPLVVAAALAASPAPAEVIFNTLPAGSQYFNSTTGGDALAQSFSTTATGSTITSAVLRLSNNYPQPQGNYSVSIWGSDLVSHAPTAQVASIYSGNMSNLPNAIADVTYSGLNIALAPMTSYYMVVFTDPAAGGIRWAHSSSATGSPGNTSQYYTSYVYNTSTWLAPLSSTSSARIMEITATAPAPVPEIDPAGASSVMALVAGALGLLERRVRQMLA